MMIDGFGGHPPFPNGTYVIFWPHFQLPKIPALIQVFAQLARSTTEKVKRIAMIVPASFNLPAELHESVALLDFALPNREELAEAYDRVVQSVSDERQRPPYSGEDLDVVMNAVTGMTEMEAESALARAAAKFKTKFPNVTLDAFVAEVMKIKTEVIKRSECLEIMPVETMDNIGGLEALKQWVTERKPALTHAAREAGVDKPKGFLLVGAPGTGKSLAAKATAHTLGLPLIRFDISKVYGGLVGESESRVRDALKTVEAMAPCVCMVDVTLGIDSGVLSRRDHRFFCRKRRGARIGAHVADASKCEEAPNIGATCVRAECYTPGISPTGLRCCVSPRWQGMATAMVLAAHACHRPHCP